MKVGRPKTDKWHNYDEDDGMSQGKFIYHKKGFWKKYDRKKFFRNLFKSLKRNGDN